MKYLPVQEGGKCDTFDAIAQTGIFRLSTFRTAVCKKELKK
jgi:hypothetical protein